MSDRAAAAPGRGLAPALRDALKRLGYTRSAPPRAKRAVLSSPTAAGEPGVIVMMLVMMRYCLFVAMALTTLAPPAAAAERAVVLEIDGGKECDQCAENELWQ